MAKRAMARPVRIEWPDPSAVSNKKKGTRKNKKERKLKTNWLENAFRMVKI